MARSSRTGRPLRVAVVAPRCHPDIIGGSERFLLALCEGLVAHGCEVELVTTRSAGVRFDAFGAVRWEREIAADRDPLPGLRIVRCDPAASSERARARRGERLASAWARAVAGHPASADSPHLAAGFQPLETTTGGRAFRWTRGRSAIALGAGRWSAARLDLRAAWRVEIRAALGGRDVASAPLEPNRWTPFEVPLSGRTASSLELCVAPARRAPDGRLLGVAVGGISLLRNGDALSLPLERDDDSLLAEMETRPLAALLDRRAVAIGWRAGLADALRLGPWSARLALSAWRAARRADVVMATNAPYATLAIGWMAARAARRPIVALPFFHLRDPAHHRPQVRAVLRRVDRILCLHDAMRRFAEAEWARPTALLGGGCDVGELSSAAISGSRFRSRHGLEQERIVLQVGRKTPSKNYRWGAECVARLRAQGDRVRFVMIGPDEDGIDLAPLGVLNLGALSRADLLDAIDACDVLVLPSLQESFGLVFLEAWMRGKPVVGHRQCEAARELIRAGEDGELVATVDELVGALDRLLGDESYAARLGERGRERTLERGGWQAVAARALAALNEVAGE